MYSIKLHIITNVCVGEEAYALREDYIHVTDESGAETHELQITNYELSNYPNPFNPTTTISFETTNLHENTRIEIYNLKGQKIRKFSIFNDQSSIEWDGTDDNNKPVSSGIYFYKLKSSEIEISRKMLLLK